MNDSLSLELGFFRSTWRQTSVAFWVKRPEFQWRCCSQSLHSHWCNFEQICQLKSAGTCWRGYLSWENIGHEVYWQHISTYLFDVGIQNQNRIRSSTTVTGWGKTLQTDVDVDIGWQLRRFRKRASKPAMSKVPLRGNKSKTDINVAKWSDWHKPMWPACNEKSSNDLQW